MNGNCILVWLGLATAFTALHAGEQAPSAVPAPAAAVAEHAPDEQWQYHEKWDKAQQRGLVPAPKGVAPATECRPGAVPDRGAVRPAPLPGRCPDSGIRVRT